MESSKTKPKICGSSSEGVDRISSLPDDILHKVLASFTILDMAQLSLLSKQWRYIWTTLPYFHFDHLSYFSLVKQFPDFPTPEELQNFINWVLTSQSAVKFVRFILCCGDLFDKVAILRWIDTVARQYVQELVLSFDPDEPFELPYCLANCESLQVLKLKLGGDILKPPNHLGFSQLKFLHLVDVELHYQLLTSCFFSNCHLLENLILENCTLGAMTLLHIASTSLISVTLRNDDDHVESYGDCKVKISCPNLKFLKYQAPSPKDIYIENPISIEVVDIFFQYDEDTSVLSLEETGVLALKMIKEVSSTSVLKLCMTSFSALCIVTQRVKLPPISFYKLKSLGLAVGVDDEFMQVIMLLLKYSPNLEVFKLWSDENDGWTENWELDDPDESIVCLESHLKSIQLTNFKDEENEKELLRFFLKNARVLEKLTVVWASYYKSEDASEEVLNFPRTCSHVVVTFLDAKPRKPTSRNWYDRY